MLIVLTPAGKRAFRLLAKAHEERYVPKKRRYNDSWADALLRLIEGE